MQGIHDSPKPSFFKIRRRLWFNTTKTLTEIHFFLNLTLTDLRIKKTILFMNTNEPLNWDDFAKVEIRIGTILKAETFKEARKPAYKLEIDFGPLGTKKTSAQITKLYQPEELIGRQVLAVVNFPPKQIANFMSECLLLGAIGDAQEVTLITPERSIQNGLRIG